MLFPFIFAAKVTTFLVTCKKNGVKTLFLGWKGTKEGENETFFCFFGH